MSLVELTLLYLAVGAGLAWALALRQRRELQAWSDAALLVLAWPLLAPLMALAHLEPAPAPSTTPVNEDLLTALNSARDTPLGTLLPDEASVRRLSARLERARTRVRDVDGLLERPESAEKDAGPGRRALVARLRRLREGFQSELDAIAELLVQLRLQVEVVRLAGDVDPEVADLVTELVARVEGLGDVLDNEA